MLMARICCCIWPTIAKPLSGHMQIGLIKQPCCLCCHIWSDEDYQIDQFKALPVPVKEKPEAIVEEDEEKKPNAWETSTDGNYLKDEALENSLNNSKSQTSMNNSRIQSSVNNSRNQSALDNSRNQSALDNSRIQSSLVQSLNNSKNQSFLDDSKTQGSLIQSLNNSKNQSTLDNAKLQSS